MTKRCTSGFSVWQNGSPVVYAGGALVADDDPILETHGHLFADVDTLTARRGRGPEAATADPGQRRERTIPPAPASDMQEPGQDPGDPQPAEPYDPGAATVKDVLAHLDTVTDPGEAERILDAEQAGQARAGILGQRDAVLARYAA